MLLLTLFTNQILFCLGNLAFHKLARQSSTYDSRVASLAVDGSKSWNSSTCSETVTEWNKPHWWYVTLSPYDDIALTNIHILRAETGPVLRNFYILYTSDAYRDPHPNKWNICLYHEGEQKRTIASYRCNNMIDVARRVAVYINSSHENSEHYLQLCEVLVDGYVYKGIISSCGGTLNGSGYIRSPNYPDNYANYLNCTWRLFANTYNEKIVLEVLDFQIENKHDVLAILESGGMKYSYTGSNLNASQRLILGNGTVVTFTTDNSVVHRGFSIWFSSSDSYCGGTLYGSGYVRSPNYPDFYDNNLACTWRLVAIPDYQSVRLQVIAFSTQSCCDILSVNDSNGSAVHRLSGTNVVSTIVLGKTAVITFITDFSHANSGFSIWFSTSGTADFSVNSLTTEASCDFVSAKLLGQLDSSWTVQPSFVFYSIMAAGRSQPTTLRIAYTSAVGNAVTFPVSPNSTYSVWAAPETCWPKTNCSDNPKIECYNATNCFRGRGTTVIAVTTSRLEYDLKKQGTVISFKKKSPQTCTSPARVTASCYMSLNYLCHDNETINGDRSCFQTKFNSYNCVTEMLLTNGITVRSTYNFTFDPLSDGCATTAKNFATNSAIFMTAVIGGSVSFVLLIAVVVAIAILKCRNKSIFLRKCQATSTVPSNLLPMTTRQEAEDDAELYVNMDAVVVGSQHARFRPTERSPVGKRSKGNVYQS